ncbi:hypothetical protein CTAYLR_000615 [Chrysophaeum taylorii]|uniref:Uncharacterized protein n=1 Tax=Chrysophaeum taylorii TaxID=2483200 RepID=A0AAD7UAV9_9STRA|nr:hypothetical protein CTAYLR_000615 [Chrysophaeum taylorii]
MSSRGATKAASSSVVVAESCEVGGTRASSSMARGSKAVVIGDTGILRALKGFKDVVALVESSDPNREGPTKNNILRALDWLAESEPGDSLFFYFKGDAEVVEDDDSDYEDMAVNAAILPSDHWRSGNLMDASLRRHLVEPLKEGVRLTAVFDVRSKKKGVECLLGLPFTLDLFKGHWVRGENPMYVKSDVLAVRGDGITEDFVRLCRRDRSLIGFARDLGATLTSTQALSDLTQPFELRPRYPNPNFNAQLGLVVTKKRRKANRSTQLEGAAYGALLSTRRGVSSRPK